MPLDSATAAGIAFERMMRRGPVPSTVPHDEPGAAHIVPGRKVGETLDQAGAARLVTIIKSYWQRERSVEVEVWSEPFRSGAAGGLSVVTCGTACPQSR